MPSSQQDNTSALNGLTPIDLLPYLEMQRLLMSANVFTTDSGGMQKGAYFYRVSCITLCDETEGVETVAAGWNQLVGADEDKINRVPRSAKTQSITQDAHCGDGHASQVIVQLLG